MMKKIFVLFFCTFLYCSQHVFAGWGTDGSGDLTIDFIEIANGATTVYFNEPVYNPASCILNNNTVTWEDTNDGANKFLSAMIAAKISGNKVQVLVDRTSCLYDGGWKKLLQMKLK